MARRSTTLKPRCSSGLISHQNLRGSATTPLPMAKWGTLDLDDAGGQEVELDAAGGVAGVGASVDLQYHRHGLAAGGGAQFLDHLGDEAAFTFVAEADADVGDELAGDGSEHGGKAERRMQKEELKAEDGEKK